MQSHSSASERVRAALASLGPVVLERLDQLVDRHVRLVREGISAYSDEGLVPVEDLRNAGRANIERAVRILSGLSSAPDHLSESRTLGRRRAEEGMPLEALLSAFRLGGRVVWEGFVEAAQDSRVQVDPQALLQAASSVWEIVDEFSTALSEAYREHDWQLRRQDVRERQAMLDALVHGRGADAAFERAAAAALGLAPDAPAICVVARLDGRGQPSRSAPEDVLRSLGFASAWHVRGGTEFGIVAADEPDLPRVLRALGTRATAAMGISPVFYRLGEAAQAFRLATLALRTVPPGSVEVLTLDERIPEALVAASPELLTRLASHTVDRLAAMTSHERNTVLATIRALIANQGSSKHAAEALFCHRNTVQHRMERLKALTGVELDGPRSVLLWTLALMAVDQAPSTLIAP